MSSNIKPKNPSKESPTEPFKRAVAGCMRAIARKPDLEISYAAERPGMAGGKALKDLPVVVGHIKYSLTKEQPQRQLLQELEAANDVGVRFVIPEQGSRWHFK